MGADFRYFCQGCNTVHHGKAAFHFCEPCKDTLVTLRSYHTRLIRYGERFKAMSLEALVREAFTLLANRERRKL